MDRRLLFCIIFFLVSYSFSQKTNNNTNIYLSYLNGVPNSLNKNVIKTLNEEYNLTLLSQVSHNLNYGFETGIAKRLEKHRHYVNSQFSFNYMNWKFENDNTMFSNHNIQLSYSLSYRLKFKNSFNWNAGILFGSFQNRYLIISKNNNSSIDDFLNNQNYDRGLVLSRLFFSYGLLTSISYPIFKKSKRLNGLYLISQFSISKTNKKVAEFNNINPLAIFTCEFGFIGIKYYFSDY